VSDAVNRSTPIDDLLERSLAALNRGDVDVAHDLAGQVLAADATNPDATVVLASSEPSNGELRRASLLFADLVGSTALSSRHDPEVYRHVLRGYKATCREVVERRYGGHISHAAGDGLLAVFGLPTPHENDAERAVRAALDIVRELRSLSADVEQALGERIEARCAVHKGLVYLDTDEDEVYGLAANVVSRLQGMAPPGSVVISDDVREIVGALFETVAEPPQRAKGVEQPLRPHRVLADRPEDATRGRRWAVGLVDRAAELAILRDVWRQVREGSAGRPSPVHLLGEAGIGKSRLAAVLADEVRATPARCVQLLGSPFHADASFHAVRALLETRCRLSRDAVPVERLALLRREVAAVGLAQDELVPLLAPILGISPEAGYRRVAADARKLHESIVGAVVRYVFASLGSGPAMLLIEDLHWCDGSTLEVVAHVLRADRGDLLVVTTSRDAPPRALGRTQVITLPPLDDADAGELVRSLDPALDDSACRELVARGDGVPLFLEELVRGAGPQADQVDLIRTLHGTQTPSPSEPEPALAGTVAAPSGAVPEALYEPLVARLHATGPGLSVAAAAAAIGRDVDRRLLAQVVDVSDSDLESALMALLGGLILERALDDGQSYRFRHELLRVVAYDLQPPSRRRELHGRVADALAHESGDAGPVDWRLVASHYDAAGQPSEAVAAYARAADGARRLGALGEARAHLARAIDLISGLPDSPERRSREVGLRLRRGFLAASTEGNGSPDAVHDHERCLELGLGDVAGDDMFNTLIALWGYYMVRGDLDRAQQIAEMLRTGLAGGRDRYRAGNEAAFGTIRWYAGDFLAAHGQFEAAVADLTSKTMPDFAGTHFLPSDPPASAHAGLALARFMHGDVRGADVQIEAALRRCASIEFPQGPFTAAQTQSYAAWILIERGDLAGAAAAVATVADLAGRHGFDIWALIGATEQATIAALSALEAQPDNSAALAAQAQAVEGLCGTWKMLDVALFLPFFTTVAGRLRAASGDTDGAAARYDETLQFASTTGIHFYDAEVLRLRGHLLAGDAAVAQLRAALDVARSQGAALFELRIARDLVAQDESDALALLKSAVARFAPDAEYPELDDARAVVAAAG
jgi:class 3 adenylate cyclase/tetratricopeptide (TPR) repeat protein